MNNQQIKKIGLVAVLLMIVGAGAYYVGKSQAPAVAPELFEVAEEPAQGVPAAEVANKIEHPVPAAQESASEGDLTAKTPETKDVGTQVIENWKNFFGSNLGSEFIVPENFVHRFVLMFENATETKIPTTASIFEPVAGEFLVKSENDKTYLNEANYQRYDDYVGLLKTADFKKITAFYFKIYPLLQATYKEMGTDGYLNDRVVRVLDKVIHASTPPGPYSLVATYGRFAFEDEKLEDLSAIEKVLIRMGPAHAAVVKEKAKELRALIASQGKK